MSLCWSHAEYVSLVRSRHDGVCFDRVEPAFHRYVASPVRSRREIWSLRHPLRRVPRGKVLRMILGAEAAIVWSRDGWARTNTTDVTNQSELNLWFADFPTADWPEGTVLEFTCFWKGDQRWQAHNWRVSVVRNQTERVERPPQSRERRPSMRGTIPDARETEPI